MIFDRYRAYTQARIGLGNAGAGLPTKAWLDFSYHHACAVDAINVPWDIVQQTHHIKKLGYKSDILKTRVASRKEYLIRPDLGCLLDEPSTIMLQQLPQKTPSQVLLIASNGLSSWAVINHLNNFLQPLLEALQSAGLTLAHDRIFLAKNARVSLIDDVGEIIKPDIGLIIIGERPGLSSPDSLAAYLTYQPKKGCSHALLNCISNIRPPHGLSYEQATSKAMFLIKEALHRKISGIALKDESGFTLPAGPKKRP